MCLLCFTPPPSLASLISRTRAWPTWYVINNKNWWRWCAAAADNNRWCDDFYFFFWSNLRLNYQLIDTIIVIAIPYVFAAAAASPHSIPALLRSHSTSRSCYCSLTHSLTLSLHQKCTFFCFYYALFICCVRVVVFFYPCFFVTFRLIIKDNSNNIFFEYFPLTLLSFLFYLLCVFFFTLSFLLYCMVYYKKLFTSRVLPFSICAPLICFSLSFYSKYTTGLPSNVPPPSHSWFLISLSRSCSLLASSPPTTHIYNCFLIIIIIIIIVTTTLTIS